MNKRYTIKVYTPIEDGMRPLPDLDISADVTVLRLTTNTNGFSGLECGLRQSAVNQQRGWLPKLIHLPPRGHVEVWRGGKVIWEGRVMEAELGSDGVNYKGFVAHGYLGHLRDNWFTSSDTTDMTMSAALRYLIETHLPTLRIAGNSTQYVETGVNHPGGPSEFSRMSLADVVDQATQEADSRKDQIDVAVWKNRTIHLTTRRLVGNPDYRMPFDDRYVHIRHNFEEMVSGVMAEYGTGATGSLTGETDEGSFFARWKFRSRILLALGDVSQQAAEAVRDAHATRHSEPKVIATISLPNGRGLTGWHNVEVPPEDVRSLQWVKIADMVALPIISTTFDAMDETLNLELGEPNLSLMKNMNLRERRLASRLLRGLAERAGRRR